MASHMLHTDRRLYIWTALKLTWSILLLINFSHTGEEPYILFANRHLIRRVNLEGVEPEILINESGNAIAMDFDIRCNSLREGGRRGGGENENL